MSASSINAGSRANFERLRKVSRAMLNEAVRRGTQLHAYIDHLINTGEHDLSLFQSADYHAHAHAFRAFGAQVGRNYDVVATELQLVADTKLASIPLTGTIDALLFNKRTQRYLLVDWKSGGKTAQERNYYTLNYGLQLGVYRQLVVDNTHIKRKEIDTALVVICADGVKAYQE